MQLRLAEAQMLHEAVNDSVLGPCLRAFFEEQRVINLDALVQAVRLNPRDYAQEASLAGQITAAETGYALLKSFAERELRGAQQ